MYLLLRTCLIFQGRTGVAFFASVDSYTFLPPSPFDVDGCLNEINSRAFFWVPEPTHYSYLIYPSVYYSSTLYPSVTCARKKIVYSI